jgi:hypothetical protein
MALSGNMGAKKFIDETARKIIRIFIGEDQTTVKKGLYWLISFRYMPQFNQKLRDKK